jgi:hypothetical protein
MVVERDADAGGLGVQYKLAFDTLQKFLVRILVIVPITPPKSPEGGLYTWGSPLGAKYSQGRNRRGGSLRPGNIFISGNFKRK